MDQQVLHEPGRQGLLASQRLEEGRLRGLDTHLSYRVGLRTFSAVESRIVLGVPDAYELPSRPGSGYLKTEATEMTRFKAAYVSGPYGKDKALAVPEVRSPLHRRPVWFTALQSVPGSIGNPGTPKDTTHASSICSFSGLNDFVNGPTDFIVQSFGQDVRLGHPSPIGGITDPTVANPGDFCGHDSNPDRT